MLVETTCDKNAFTIQAAAWELLALSFRYPDTVLVDAVASGEWSEAAHEVADALGIALPQGWGKELGGYVGADEQTLLHSLRAEATRLFVGSPEPVCTPYEGVWRAADDGVQALLLVNPHSMEVERFMRACGLGQPKGTNEPLDHIATECELMEYLTLVEAGLAAASTSVEMPEDAYGQFFSEHLSTWAGRFADKVTKETREAFFVAAAQLLAAVVRAGRERL